MKSLRTAIKKLFVYKNCNNNFLRDISVNIHVEHAYTKVEIQSLKIHYVSTYIPEPGSLVSVAGSFPVVWPEVQAAASEIEWCNIEIFHIISSQFYTVFICLKIECINIRNSNILCLAKLLCFGNKKCKHTF